MEDTLERISGRTLATILLITGYVWLSDVYREPLITFVDPEIGEFRQEFIQQNVEPPKYLFSYFGYSGLLLMQEWLDIELSGNLFGGSTNETVDVTWIDCSISVSKLPHAKPTVALQHLLGDSAKSTCN